MSCRRNLALAVVGLLLGISVLALGCAVDQVTPTATPAKAPAATTTPTVVRTEVPRATTTPTQALVASPTATMTSMPSSVAKPVVLRAGAHFWGPNDPLMNTSAPHMNGLNWDVLTRINNDGTIIPRLAASWELIDPTTTRLHLRNDVKFHDGTRVTAYDAKLSIDEVIRRATNPSVGIVKEVSVVDDYTLDVKTTQPDMRVPRRLYPISILSKNQIDREGWDGFAKKPLGSGPWRWTEWVANDHTVAERVPGGHPFRTVDIDRIEMFNVADTETAVAALRTGSLDYVGNFFFPEQARDLDSRGFTVVTSGSSTIMIGLSPAEACAQGYPTCDSRVRRALNVAIDRKAIAKNLYLGYAQALSQPALPGRMGYDETLPVEYDPAMAERLLDEAGYPRGKDGNRLQLDYMNWIPGLGETMALAMIDMWQKVGVKMNYQKVEIAVAKQFLLRQDGRHIPHLFQYQNADAYGDNSSFVLNHCDDPAGKKCNVPISNPKFQALRQQIAAEADAVRTNELMKQAMRVLVEDPPTIYIVGQPYYHVYSGKWEGGGVGNIDSNLWFDNMRLHK